MIGRPTQKKALCLPRFAAIPLKENGMGERELDFTHSLISKISKEQLSLISLMIVDGTPVKYAFLRAGLTEYAITYGLRRGRKDLAAGIPSPYARLANTVLVAQADLVCEITSNIRKMALKDDLRAAELLLQLTDSGLTADDDTHAPDAETADPSIKSALYDILNELKTNHGVSESRIVDIVTDNAPKPENVA